MTAEEWFKEFYQRYYFQKSFDGHTLDQLDKKHWHVADWAKAMDAFLHVMAADLRFSVVPQSKDRVEHRWKQDAEEILVVNENDGRRVSKEIGTMCKYPCRLKVLVTYVPDEGFVGHAMELAKKVREDIDEVGAFEGEFLLVVGGTEMDWTAIKSVAKTQKGSS